MADATRLSPDSKVARLAGAALQAALAGDWPRANAAVQRIDKECGEQGGVATALMTWADTYTLHTFDGPPPAAAAMRIMFWDTDTGVMGDQPDLPDTTRWAARLVTARAAMDEDTFRALIGALPDDPAAVGQHVGAVLVCVANTINRLPRGYALMGRDLSLPPEPASGEPDPVEQPDGPEFDVAWMTEQVGRIVLAAIDRDAATLEAQLEAVGERYGGRGVWTLCYGLAQAIASMADLDATSGPDEFWGLEVAGDQFDQFVAGSAGGPGLRAAVLAAARFVVAFLNRDKAQMRALIAAHGDPAGEVWLPAGLLVIVGQVGRARQAQTAAEDSGTDSSEGTAG